MPRRRTKVSPLMVLFLMFVFGIMRGLLMLPSNEEAVSSSNMLPHTIDQNPSQLSQSGTGKNHSILFVHVGKTGGETIQWRMKLSCKLRRSVAMKEECFQHFTGEESMLSRATIGHLHCNKLRPKESLAHSTAFLFSLRHPVDRIVSWFQYMHPANCVPNIPSGACNLKKDNNPWGIKFYQTCFPDINDLGRSIVKPTTNGSIDCSDLGIETVQGNGPEGPSNHMHYNYFYYFNRTLHQYPNRIILAVRQERLWEDLRSVEKFLGGDAQRPFQDQGPTITHGSEKFRYRASLDPDLVPPLCCTIIQEVKTYKYLLEEAVNLESSQKSISIMALLKKCQIHNWNQWIEDCGTQ
mmetsp:Transcript_36318/g.72294  ORF Transcript_36318/g.72294 Transcript_36318/m.72294 type:complete len:352 (+) Transcript_36318:94-1149(+)